MDFLPEAHDVFVNGVVDDFFEQDIGTIIIMGPIAYATDVHPRAKPDVLERG